MKFKGLSTVRQAVLTAALLPFGMASSWASHPSIVNEAFTGCIIYHDADLPPIRGGTLVVKNGEIAAMGPDAAVQVPEGLTVTPCEGAAILSGFWNSHIHLMDPHLANVPEQINEDFYWESQLDEMFVRYGFVALIDTGSDPRSTVPIQKALKAQAFTGPAILSAYVPFVPPNGTPFYAKDVKFVELEGAMEGRVAAGAWIELGANVLKLMTVSLTEEKPYPAMPLETIQAVTSKAHSLDKLVLAHPTNREGVELALEGGVDVLLHTAPIGGPWDDALVKRMVAANMALVPTLALWDYEAAKTGDDAMAKHFREVSAQQVRSFAKAGGRILFGTDAGYMPEYDPTNEYLAMQAAGLSFQQILASLTKNPAMTFKGPYKVPRDWELTWWIEGVLRVGDIATFLMVDGDPAEDIRRLAQVRYTFINGQQVYARQP
ncbi:MAG TPA: amidohydrolase family protein [Pedomonas sp.]|uniref:amidohydrolase family protein n=1 Tax=Pedomonas sp. TaxID=2976421 RepID=UPI002F3FC1E8